MYNDYDFGDFFGSLFRGAEMTADGFRKRLDDCWSRCDIERYYSTLQSAKIMYRVLRNSKGEHRVEKR